MVSGRLRTTTPEDPELIKLGQELVKWATDEKTDELRCRFSQWYSLIKGITHNEWDLMLQKPVFRGYYEKAQTALAQKYVDGSVKDSIGHRFLRIYSPEVKHQENQDKEDDLERELEIKKKLIDHQSAKENKNLSPIQDQIDLRHENMLLKAELESLKANANKP